MFHAVLTRLNDDGVQTLGEFVLYDNRNETIFACKTLELPDKANRMRVSCIPPGNYECHPRISPKYGKHFRVWKNKADGVDVPGRSYILIHPGNYHRHTLGCILIGQAHLDINSDGHRDVTSSKATMAMLNKVTGRRMFRMEIRDRTGRGHD